MNEGQKILKEQIEKLPKKLRDYILEGDWANKLQDILSKFNLEEHQKISIENETLLVIIGLEPYLDLKENLEKEAEISSDIAEYITGEISENILDQINTEETKNEAKPQSNVGQSFEQIILNQAKAMQPAIPPENLPIEDKSGNVHDYKPGSDPYREPLQ